MSSAYGGIRIRHATLDEFYEKELIKDKNNKFEKGKNARISKKKESQDASKRDDKKIGGFE